MFARCSLFLNTYLLSTRISHFSLFKRTAQKKIFDGLIVGFCTFSFLLAMPIQATIPVTPTIALDQLEELEQSDPIIQRIYFIRHGESEFNQPDAHGLKITSGKSLAAQLTTTGEEQALALAKKLANKINLNEKILIVSSTAVRAQETARLLFGTLKTSHSEVELGQSYDGLCELGMGEWEGKPKDKALEEALEPWEKLSAADKFITDKIEGGENFRVVAYRSLEELDKIVKEHFDKTILIVSHFHTMNALALELKGAVPFLSKEPHTSLPFLIFDNCDLLELEISQEKETATVKMHIQTNV